MALAQLPEATATQLSLLAFLERVQQLQEMPYENYLKTPEWLELRSRALKRAGYRCQLNATHWHSLQVHHRTYARRGVEQISDLVVLCDECHWFVHRYVMGSPDHPQAA